MIFRDRVEAGKKLGTALTKYRGLADVVLSIPSGGAVCGVGVAEILGLPHDLIFINKISHPRSPEYAVGAVNENGKVILKGEAATLGKQWLDAEIEQKKIDIRRRRRIFLTNRPPVALHNKVVVIVDDKLGNDVSMLSAIEYVKHHKAGKIIVAVPVAYTGMIKKIEPAANEIVALHVTDEPFTDPGYYYSNFKEVLDSEIMRIIEMYKL